MINVRYTEYPWPYFHGSFDDDFYQYVNEQWSTEESEKKWNKVRIRSNIIIKNPQICDILTEVGNKLILQSEDLYKKHYPKLNKLPIADNPHHLFSENPPSESGHDMRKRHLDNGNKMASGLWYFRNPDDDDGGDLILYNPITKEKDVFKYDTNKIILFPNLPISWHTITRREKSKYPRRFVCLVMESSKTVLHNYKLDNFKDVQTYEETVNHYE